MKKTSDYLQRLVTDGKIHIIKDDPQTATKLAREVEDVLIYMNIPFVHVQLGAAFIMIEMGVADK